MTWELAKRNLSWNITTAHASMQVIQSTSLEASKVIEDQGLWPTEIAYDIQLLCNNISKSTKTKQKFKCNSKEMSKIWVKHCNCRWNIKIRSEHNHPLLCHVHLQCNPFSIHSVIQNMIPYLVMYASCCEITMGISRAIQVTMSVCVATKGDSPLTNFAFNHDEKKLNWKKST